MSNQPDATVTTQDEVLEDLEDRLEILEDRVEEDAEDLAERLARLEDDNNLIYIIGAVVIGSVIALVLKALG